MDTHALARVTPGPAAISGRDLVRPLFRRRRVVAGLFAALTLLAIAAAVAWPKRYVAEMKILVKRDRVEPLVTPERDAPGITRPEVNDSDIYSEVALLKSRDLLRDVAVASGLANPTGKGQASPAATARAVQNLARDLEVAPVRKAALIEVSYAARDPQLASRVLSNLARLYLEKHLAVHRAPGAQEFFRQQAERLRGQLQDAKTRLLAFGNEHHVVSAASERDATLSRLAEFQATLEQLHAQTADADRRLAALEEETRRTPDRLVTQQRRLDNGALVGDLSARILDLEVKRTEMLRKFTPAYPPVLQLEQQLAQARTALTAAQQSPIKDEATDRNPTYQWLRNEVARVQAERAALQARAAATMTTIRDYERRARSLDEQGTAQQDLLRDVKAAEDNYLLYQRKAEESRISDALDQRRIANVSLAEEPVVPLIPSGDRRLVLLAGLFLATVVSLGAAFLLEHLDPRFRTRRELEAVLELPVLAAIPASCRR